METNTLAYRGQTTQQKSVISLNKDSKESESSEEESGSLKPENVEPNLKDPKCQVRTNMWPRVGQIRPRN